MNKDIKIDELRANCFRQSRVSGEFMFQMRVPGGTTEAKHLSLIQDIAINYGNGTFHFGPRQTFNIPGIKYEHIKTVNKLVKSYIKEVEIENCHVDMENNDLGYPALGARNVVACIGGEHCVKANTSAISVAKKIEKIIYPSNYHVKINVAGCPNDCVKGHMSDFGVYGVTLPNYRYDRCVDCGACARICAAHSTSAITELDGKMDINKELCIGCGECTTVCPSGAMLKSNKKLYRVTIGGRTGKSNPRIGKIFVDYVTEDVLLGIFKNWIPFSQEVLNNKAIHLHGGHLIDKVGYNKFKEMLLKGIVFNEEAKVAERVNWSEVEYKANRTVKSIT